MPSRKRRTGTYWSTQDELHFIAELGTHREQFTGHAAEEYPLLKGYLLGAQQRVDWADVQKGIVVAAALKRLQYLQGRQKMKTRHLREKGKE